MSNRIKGLTVALQHDFKDEDVEQIVKAIGMIKGVIAVTPLEVSSDDFVNRAQIKWELHSKLIQILVE